MSSTNRNIITEGGGISGLYCGWRLQKAGVPPAERGIFAACDCVGGRIRTEVWRDVLSRDFETGARYVDTRHPLTIVTLGLLEVSLSLTDRSEKIRSACEVVAPANGTFGEVN